MKGAPKVFPTENIDLGCCLRSIGITIAICQVTLQLMLLYKLTNHVTNCYCDVCRREGSCQNPRLFQLGKNSIVLYFSPKGFSTVRNYEKNMFKFRPFIFVHSERSPSPGLIFIPDKCITYLELAAENNTCQF